MGSASSLAEQASLFRSLSASVGLVSSVYKGLAATLTGSVGSSSSFSEQSSLVRSLTASLGIAGVETKGLATSLNGGLGLASSFAEQVSFVRSLVGSLSSGSALVDQVSLSRYLNGTLTVNSQSTKGSIESLGGHINTPTILTGNYECHETLLANCGTVSASFAYLVVALGAIAFAIYAIRLRGVSPGPKEAKPEKVVVDKEGWETKDSQGKKRKETKPSNEDDDWEKKPER
jgi:hypothetical protein